MGAENEKMGGENLPFRVPDAPTIDPSYLAPHQTSNWSNQGQGDGVDGASPPQNAPQTYFPYQQPPPYLFSIPGINTAQTPLVPVSEPTYNYGGFIVKNTATQHELNLAKECSDLHDKMTASTDQAGVVHIAKAELDRFLELYRLLSIPKDLHNQLDQQPAAAATTAGRNTTTNLSQASDLFHQGYRAGYASAFELGRRSASPVAYKMHIGALTAVSRRVSLLRHNLGRLRDGDGLAAALAELDVAVQRLLAQTRAAAASEGLSFNDMFQIAVQGKYAEYIGLAGVEPTVEGWDGGALAGAGAGAGAGAPAAAINEIALGQAGGGEVMEGGWQVETGIGMQMGEGFDHDGAWVGGL
ncbi:hypothetical protein MMYC01_207142 [Madurella mycetomatis]|uniref:Uncharacterized protein n=1 Tax=Madurella mycetomatis TaxID=100816 RepID=A0A175W0K2_9PEZI|nr:hypothetical protein MMYC01_207142 [Madurella mycetomatis]